MIDSELSWKHHNDFVCGKISRSVGIIAKMRHCIPWHLLLNLYLALIVPYLNYGICVHRPASIRYLSPRNIFFIESNCFPLQSLFFQQLSYSMTFMLRQLLKVFLIRLRKSIQNIILIRHYLQKNVSLSNSLELKKWENLLLGLLCLFGILFHFLLRLSTYLIFVKKNNNKIKN